MPRYVDPESAKGNLLPPGERVGGEPIEYAPPCLRRTLFAPIPPSRSSRRTASATPGALRQLHASPRFATTAAFGEFDARPAVRSIRR